MRDLFLCHTGADKDWVKELGARLEAEEINGHSTQVWFDEWDIAHGKSIISAIGEGLANSRFVGVVLSPAMVKADWPTAEWQSVVIDDPLNRHGRILPLLRHKFDPFTGEAIEIPWVLKPLKRFDFSRPAAFDVEYRKLLRHLRGLQPERGSMPSGRLGAAIGTLSLGHDTPDEVPESLTSNLLPVSRLPETIHSDLTPVKDYDEIWDAFPRKTVPPFALHNHRLFSFYPPGAPHHPFKRFLLGTAVQASETAGLLKDFESTKMLIGMFNAALRQHCRKLGILNAKKDRQFYCPVSAPKSRYFQWEPKGRKRTLAKLIKGPKGRAFGVHYAARMRFTMAAGRLYLIIEPAWMFTLDGLTPIEGVEAGVLSTKWGGRERNAAVLRNVLMWALMLSRGDRIIKLALGPHNAEIQTLPALGEINMGIDGDQIRVDRLLKGEGAGEVTADGRPLDELDIVANLALLGLADQDQSVAQTERLPEESQDPEPKLPL